MPVTDALYHEIALADPEGKWELVGGRLRSKPTMSSPHNSRSYRLSFLLASQLDWNEYEVRQDQSRVQHLAGSYFIPDVFVFPVSALKPGWETSRELEVFEGALPFVAEVWSPSTGEYDQASKLPEYMARGDLEIWLVHPYDQTIAAWRRQESGEYVRTLHREGIVTIASLLGVTINMAELFR